MRKLIISSVALGPVLALVALALAAGPPTFSVTTGDSDKSGTPARPKGIELLFAANDKRARSAVLRKVTFYFDRNLVFRGAAFPRCATAVAVEGRAGCGLRTQVGGTPAAFGGRSWSHIYNGPNGNTLVFEASQGTKYYTVVGRLLPAGGAIYGKKLVIPIPKFLVQPRPGKLEGFIFWLNNVTNTQKSPYLGLKGCTGGVLRFRVSFAYTGATRSDTAGTRCSR